MGKINFKPGTMLNPVPAVMVSCGNEEKHNIITNNDENKTKEQQNDKKQTNPLKIPFCLFQSTIKMKN